MNLFCLVDLDDPDLIENFEAAALKKDQPIFLWGVGSPRVLGPQPSHGNREAFQFAIDRGTVKASEFSESRDGMSIANASTKFKQLFERGFLLRQERAAETGGIEYRYHCVG